MKLSRVARSRIALSIAALSLLFLFSVACDDGDDGTDASTGTPAATAGPAFDPALLTAIVLTPTDLPGYETSSAANPSDPAVSARSFTSFFRSDSLRIQSTIVHYPDEAQATEDFQRNRRVLPSFGARESNLDLEGADIAFLYNVPTPPGTATWAIVDNYVIFVQMAPTNRENPDPAAVDVAQLQAYANTMLERLEQVISDPASVTPVPLSEFNPQPPEQVPPDASPTANP